MVLAKKVICCLITCCLLLPPLAVGSLAAAERGDVNGNGRLDCVDVALIIQHEYSSDENMQQFEFSPLSDEQVVAADVNEDGMVTYEDADLLLQQETGHSEDSSIALPEGFPENALIASNETELGICIPTSFQTENNTVHVGDYIEIEIYANSKKMDVNGAFLLQYDPSQLAFLDYLSSKACDAGYAGLVKEGYFTAGIANLDWSNGEEDSYEDVHVPIAIVMFQVLQEGELDLALSVLGDNYSLFSEQEVVQPEPVEAKIETSNIGAWMFEIGNSGETQEVFIQGDMNADGSITSSDARMALRGAVGLEDLDAALTERADLNGDGRLTTADARLILRIAVGLAG